MARTIKENSNQELETNIVKNDESMDSLELEKEKNKKLESELNELKLMMTKILEQQNQSVKKEDVKTKNKNMVERYKNIDPNERILIMNMVNAGATYLTHDGKPIRFDFFGQIQAVTFKDLESLFSRYNSYFKNLEIRILNDEAIDVLYLRNDYNKNDISKEELESLIDLSPQEMISKIKELTKPLQESAISLIIQRAAENDTRYVDMNKWAVLNNFAGIDISSMLGNYMVGNA